MLKIVFASALVLTSTGMAMASGGNSAAAQAMAAVLKAVPGTGAAAPTVSGKNAVAGDSGWGNAGSRLVVGTQVSRGK